MLDKPVYVGKSEYEKVHEEVKAIEELCHDKNIMFINNAEGKASYTSTYIATFRWEGINKKLLGLYDKLTFKFIEMLIKKLAPTINLISVETEQHYSIYNIWIAIHTKDGIYMCKLREL